MIAIDVGHSRLHPGAISARGVPEFEFNSALASIIQTVLSSQYVQAFQIAADGNMSNLPERTSIAKERNATFFLSIHHDSAQPRYFEKWKWEGEQRQYSDKFSGFSLFVSRKNPFADTSLHCASMIGAALIQSGFHPSPHHAEDIPGENRLWADQTNGVYYYDDLVVLKTAAMPAVLLEAGIIVNRQEELRLEDSKLRHSIAMSIKRGLSDCGAMN